MKQLLHTCFILSVFFFVRAEAQPAFWNTKDAYLGQPAPGELPVIFAPGILTDQPGFFPMGRIAFSKNGTQLVYGSNNSWYSGKELRIKTISFANGKWGEPQVINAGLGAPSFSTDNKTLYFQGPRVGERAAAYISHQTDTGWSPASVFITRSYGLYNIMPTASGRFYVGSNGNGGKLGEFGTYDISVMPANLEDSSIVSLGEPVNTAAFEGDLYIAPDESYLILSAKETPSFESELWISFHKTDGTWTVPVSLGDEINKGTAHRFGQYVSPDNKYLFFTKGTSEKDCNIYWMRFDKLFNRLRKQVLGK